MNQYAGFTIYITKSIFITVRIMHLSLLINLFVLFSFQLLAQQNAIIVRNIDSHTLKEKLEEDIHLVDVRTYKEYQAGHIAGAIQVDISRNDFLAEMNKLDKSKPIVLYCAIGARSTAAMRKIKLMGFKEILNFKGGVREWKLKKYSLVKE
ncbi:MAG: rhodanese-like domain-containing protein [Bacteroidota bacterium]